MAEQLPNVDPEVLFRWLARPGVRRLLEIAAREPDGLLIADGAGILGVSHPMVAQLLKGLERDGIVCHERIGRVFHYYLAEGFQVKGGGYCVYAGPYSVLFERPQQRSGGKKNG